MAREALDASEKGDLAARLADAIHVGYEKSGVTGETSKAWPKYVVKFSKEGDERKVHLMNGAGPWQNKSASAEITNWKDEVKVFTGLTAKDVKTNGSTSVRVTNDVAKNHMKLSPLLKSMETVFPMGTADG